MGTLTLLWRCLSNRGPSHGNSHRPDLRNEPFNTFIYILIVVLFVVIVLYIAAQLLGLAGIHVNTFGFGRF